MEQKEINDILNLRESGISLREISKRLNINRSTVAYVCNSNNAEKIANAIAEREKERKKFEELVCRIAPKCFTYSQICTAVGKNRSRQYIDRIKQILKENNIDISHFKPFYHVNVPHGEKMSNEEMFRNGSNVDCGKLKNRLFKESLKEYKCEICGISEWNGQKISLQLHHINGDHHDNRIENLQILCPNCHSQTKNFCRRKNSKSTSSIKRCPISIDEDKVLLEYKNSGSLEKVAKVIGVSSKTIKKYFKEHNLLPNGKKIRDLVVEKYGAQPQWDEYRNFTAIIASSKSKSYAVLQYDLEGNLIKRYDCIQDVRKDGFTPKSVIKCVNGQLKKHKNFVWKKEF